MRRSDRATSGGGSGHPSLHHGQGPRRGERNPHRASGPFDPFNEGSNMERGMIPYDSSDEDRDMESNVMHRRGGGQEDLYRQSHHDGYERDEDLGLARRSRGNGYGAYGAGNGRADHLHSGSEHRPSTRHGSSSSGYNNFEERRPPFDGQLVLGPRSNRELRAWGNRTSPIDLHGFRPREEQGAEWWAEENRRDRQSNPNQITLGYWAKGDDPEGDPIFVPNPTLDSSYAGMIERYRNSMLRR